MEIRKWKLTLDQIDLADMGRSSAAPVHVSGASFGGVGSD
jgi:hypothetical protein